MNMHIEYRWWFRLLLPVLNWLIAQGWLDREWVAQLGVRIVVDESPSEEEGKE